MCYIAKRRNKLLCSGKFPLCVYYSTLSRANYGYVRDEISAEGDYQQQGDGINIVTTSLAKKQE